MDVERVAAGDEGRYQRLMEAHHYLGALPKIGETLWYAASWRNPRLVFDYLRMTRNSLGHRMPKPPGARTN